MLKQRFMLNSGYLPKLQADLWEKCAAEISLKMESKDITSLRFWTLPFGNIDCFVAVCVYSIFFISFSFFILPKPHFLSMCVSISFALSLWVHFCVQIYRSYKSSENDSLKRKKHEQASLNPMAWWFSLSQWSFGVVCRFSVFFLSFTLHEIVHFFSLFWRNSKSPPRPHSSTAKMRRGQKKNKTKHTHASWQIRTKSIVCQ